MSSDRRSSDWYIEHAKRAAERATAPDERLKHLKILWATRMQSSGYLPKDRLGALTACYEESRAFDPDYMPLLSASVGAFTEAVGRLQKTRGAERIFLTEGGGDNPWHILKSFGQNVIDSHPPIDGEHSPLIQAEYDRGHVRVYVNRTETLADDGDAIPDELIGRRTMLADVPLPYSIEQEDAALDNPIPSLHIGQRSIIGWLSAPERRNDHREFVDKARAAMIRLSQSTSQTPRY